MSVAKSRKNTPGSNSKKMIVGAGILLCIIIIVVMLYPMVRNYYLAYRANEQLLQELAAVDDRNDQIRTQIAYLNTEEGIADRARERFGWVLEGEQAVNITGLTVSDSTTMLPAAVKPGSGSAPDTWWTQLCDVLFGVEVEQDTQSIPDPFISDGDTG